MKEANFTYCTSSTFLLRLAVSIPLRWTRFGLYIAAKVRYNNLSNVELREIFTRIASSQEIFMLIDFTVENYRSIKTPVTLSAIAQKAHAKQSRRDGVIPDNEIAPPYVAEGRNFELLPVLALYGANASGKTNVLTALDNFMALIGLFAGQKRERMRRITPFKLDALAENASTVFTARILAQDIIYFFTIRLAQQRILLEQLDYLPTKARRPHALYRAEWNEAEGKYQWTNGVDFAGPHKQLQPSWMGTEPFLGVFSSLFSLDVVRPLTNILTEYWFGVHLGQEALDQRVAAAKSHSHPDEFQQVAQLLKALDIGLSDLRLEWDETKFQEAQNRFYELIACHETSEGAIEWPFEEESGGTRSLFPLLAKMVHTFKFGGLMLVDELGANLHPNLTRRIIQMFQSPKSNPKRAQLIFTTHDSNLLRRDLLRRDQVWFTKKQADGSTDLYSLSDFKPRNDLALDRSYLDGRFGAIPILPDEEQLVALFEASK